MRAYRSAGRACLVLCLIAGRAWAFPAAVEDDTVQTIPVGGNAWVLAGARDASAISDSGLVAWTDTGAVCRVMFRVSAPARLQLALRLHLGHGSATVRVSALGKTFEVPCSASAGELFSVGEVQADRAGYIAVDLRGTARTGSTFGRLEALEVRAAGATRVGFVRNNDGNFFYWGRRGPSVHLNYVPPADTNVEWFYNEVSIPRSQDVIGSFFMADGFTGGYFGMQVNSETERRILFSVWSPFATDDPAAIPADQRVVLLKKGQGVHAGEFGDEGAGGQSYLVYDWKADSTYRFLLHGDPEPGGSTVYSAYFFAPEAGRWMLVASFRRPKTSTYLRGLHSFLENFVPETGLTERSGRFGNQWARGATSGWHELTRARFSADNTARQGYRMDYAGGTSGRSFVLRNCGFFDDLVPIGTVFQRDPGGAEPAIDLSGLP